MKLALTLAVLLVLAGSACGGSDDGGASGTTTQLSAGDVEAAVGDDLRSGSGSGGVVELDGMAPKSIECTKGGSEGGWDCRVTPASGGRTILCMVEVEPGTRKVTKRTCAPVDY